MPRKSLPEIPPTKTIEDYTTPTMMGRFNLFNTPDGGFHVAYQEDPTEENPEPETQHIDIPGAIVRASKMLSEGKMTPMKAMDMFMSLGRG